MKAGGNSRWIAILVIAVFAIGSSIYIAECISKFSTRTIATKEPPSAASILDTAQEKLTHNQTYPETIFTHSGQITPTVSKYQSRADAVKTLSAAIDLLGQVQFAARESNPSVEAMERLAKLADKIYYSARDSGTIDDSMLADFRQDFLVLRPQLTSAKKAFIQVHELIMESAENYALVGPLHPELALQDQNILRALAVFGDFEQLGITEKPKCPSTNIFFASLTSRFVRDALTEITAVLAKLNPSQTQAKEPEPKKNSVSTIAPLSQLEKQVNAWTTFEKAMTAHRSNNLKDAEAGYRQAIADDPTLGDAYQDLAIILFGQNKSDEGRRMLETAIRVNPKLSRSHWMLGLVEAESHKLPEALSEMRKAVEWEPSSALYRVGLAKIIAMQGSHREAAEAFRDAVALAPANWDANWGYAQELWFDDQDDNALKAYENCLRLNPDYTLSFLRIGQIMWAKGDRARAIASLDQAVIKDSKNGRFLLQRAEYHLKNCDWTKAKSDYEAALALDTNDADAIDGLARVEYGQGRPKSAAELSRRALAIRPSFVSAKLLLSITLMAQKQYAEAEEFILAAMHAHPDVPEFPINLSACYYGLGQSDAAFSVLRRAVVEFPKSEQLLRMLATEQKKRGLKVEAAKSFAACIAAEPKSIDGRIGYAELLVDLRRFDEAILQYQELSKLDPGNEKYRSALELVRRKARK